MTSSTPHSRIITIVSLLIAMSACSSTDRSLPTGTSSPAHPSMQGPSASSSVVVPRTVLSISPAPYRLRAPVQREVAVWSGTGVFLAGGLDSTGTSASGVFWLNPGAGHLKSLGSMQGAFHDAAGAFLGGQLLVFGGGTSSGTDLVRTIDPATGTSWIVGHMPVALSDLSAATVGDTAYLVGGYDGSSPRAEIYSTRNGKHFQTVAKLPVGLRYPAVTVVGSSLIIAGGQAASGPVDTVLSFATKTGRISRIGNLPSPIADASAFTLGDRAYVAGGSDPSGSAVDTVTSVDPSTGQIRAEDPLGKPISDAPAVQTDTGALIIGGARGSAVSDVLVATLVTAEVAPSASASPTVTDAAQVRPFAGLLLIADRGNDRLLVMNAKKHIVWRYPAPGLPPPPGRFYFPDDAFWVHGGNAILVNEEENDTLALIAYPSGETLWTYGHPGVSGSAPGYLHQPDDLYPYPGGGMIVSDAKNCRLLFFNANGVATHQIGTTGNCTHDLPHSVGYPNGDTPLPNGHILVSELNGGWIDEITPTGHVVWSTRVAGVTTPSDPQPMEGGSFMVADYASPGGVVRFDSTGKVLWSYRVASGKGMLDHPSLAIPLPNGLVAVNDDYNHRVVLIDPKTNKVVWQYGTGIQGRGPGQLSFPDGMDLLLPGNVIPLHVDFPSSATRPGKP